MYPVIYTSGGVKLAVLDNLVKDSAVIGRVVNGEFTFTFEAYEKELKSEYFEAGNTIVIDGQTFDIKYLEQKHELEVTYKIECEHVNYRMEDGAGNVMTPTVYSGTPTQILTTILAGTDFAVGTIDFTASTTITLNEEVTRKALIYQLANQLGGEIDYSDEGFTIDILNTIGQDNGFQIRLGKNLKGITKIIDNRGELKTYYEVDLLELKNSNEYIEKGLQDLEVIGVGDTIRIIDEVIGLDVINRIVSIEYNPEFAVNTKLEIANELELVTDSINEIDTSTVKLGKAYNNVSISTEFGFQATRDDGKALTQMNATEGISIYTDEGSGRERNFFVDTNGRIQAKALDISGDSTFGGRLQIFDGANVQVDIFEDASGGYAFFNDNGGDRCVQIGSDPTNQTGLLLLFNGDGSPTSSDDVRSELSIAPTEDTGQLILYKANRDEGVRVTARNKGGYFSVLDEADDSMVFLGNDEALSANNYGYLSLRQAGNTHSLFFKGANGGVINLRDPAGVTETLIAASGTSYFDNGAIAINAISAAGYELFVEGDEKINSGSLLIERDTDGGYVFVNNDDGYRAVQLGVNPSYNYESGLFLLYNGTAAEDFRVSIGVNATDDYGFIGIYYGANANTIISNSSGDASISMYDAAGAVQNRLVADGNNYLNNRLSVGNSNFLTDYSINTEEGIRCPFMRIVEATAAPAPTTDGVIYVVSNKLYVRLGGVAREVALV